jgi:hypothetical protein
VSPDFAQDHTVFAFDHMGSRFYASTDGGTHWQVRGRLPELGNAEFAVSVTWVIPATQEQPRVLLALATSGTEFGGAAHWPEAGARLFRSVDDGATWDLAWEAGDPSDVQNRNNTLDEDRFSALDGTLLGPVATERYTTWLLHLDSWPSVGTLFSEDGIHWTLYHLPGYWNAVPLTAWADGRVLVSTGWPGPTTEVRADDFEYGPAPTPTPTP